MLLAVVEFTPAHLVATGSHNLPGNELPTKLTHLVRLYSSLFAQEIPSPIHKA
jgi:hypothetical protein